MAVNLRSSPKNPLRPALKKLARATANLNPHARAFLVGGFVRDSLLGLAPKDADVEVYGVRPQELEGILRKLFAGRVNAVGKSFGVFKASLKTGQEIDVSIPRRESKTGRGHTEFQVTGDPNLPLEAAASRRDFTINALSAHIVTGEIIDHFGGLRDLKKRTLRAVNPKTFVEDPLRVYRALQFTARFDLNVDPKTLALLKGMVRTGELDALSRDRISAELEKLLLKAERPSLGLELADQIGLIKKYFPELAALKKTPQDPHWHPEGDVWTHTLMSVDAAAALIKKSKFKLSNQQKLAVMLAALSHDIGKAPTTKFIKDRWRSYGHDRVGAKLVKKFLAKFSFGRTVEAAVIIMVGEHMQPKLSYKAVYQGKMNKAQYAGAVRRLLGRLHPVSWQMLLLLSEADSGGRGPKKVADFGKPEKMMLQAVQKQGWDKKLPAPLLEGRDILNLAKKLKIPLSPGPKIGELLRAVEKKRDAGKITTKSQALAWLKSRF